MRVLTAFIADKRAAAAAEFVLAFPMFIVLMFVAIEAGNFMWSQQKLVESMRDAARYAARLSVDEICLPSSPEPAWKQRTRNMARFGNIAGTGPVKLPGWTDGQVIADAPENCMAFTDTGIYSSLGKSGPIVVVHARAVPYRSIAGTLGFYNKTYYLAAEASAPVIGI